MLVVTFKKYLSNIFHVCPCGGRGLPNFTSVVGTRVHTTCTLYSIARLLGQSFVATVTVTAETRFRHFGNIVHVTHHFWHQNPELKALLWSPEMRWNSLHFGIFKNTLRHIKNIFRLAKVEETWEKMEEMAGRWGESGKGLQTKFIQMPQVPRDATVEIKNIKLETRALRSWSFLPQFILNYTKQFSL